MIYYTTDHEWIDIENGMGKVGISPHAIDQLGDVIFVELPDSGKQVAAGDAVAVFESVKAASDIYSPVSGTITDVNDALLADVSSITPDTAKASWLFKIKLTDESELNKLMDEAAYLAMTVTE